MRIRIEGSDLPGLICGAAGDFPGARNIHVGVQRKDRPGEPPGLRPGDAPSASWTPDCTATATDDGIAVTGPYAQNRLGRRFVHPSWGAVDDHGVLSVFRRATLMFDDVDPAVFEDAVRSGRLTARLRLSDAKGKPIRARARPPVVTCSAIAPG
ncbi:DUF5990 family protein [Streptomyces sp. NPDC057486]|uniref:DUF5990 family protein n=1 Tax=Streptomyces sp. NPDC057486 TaxID=3346145 RepID=UPI003685BF9B